jgi:DNA-binding response OmpR family regulator
MVEVLSSEKKSVRLLVIHESTLYSDLIREHCELLSHEYRIDCKVASDCKLASTLMQCWIPTVVLIDAYGSSVDCVQFLEDWGKGLIPIVVVSDFLSSTIKNAMLSRGATEYLTTGDMPEDVEYLLERVVDMSPEALDLH